MQFLVQLLVEIVEVEGETQANPEVKTEVEAKYL
jgi:hypothetical protein